MYGVREMKLAEIESCRIYEASARAALPGQREFREEAQPLAPEQLSRFSVEDSGIDSRNLLAAANRS